ncbi:S9 family peptidase [Sphingomonas sp. AR_OL41]|uniref:S9 family peptidase n=1 Tax=Sphingomonas sp. AR_OL41 TaxID=3042729 RepID=UPI002480CC04|nr:S9 family peptidase [Sphingomonas sp. AR_OL41]MDH7975482.1 S9 family peptidase [Sphingomonas sp. AR_OL41]
MRLRIVALLLAATATPALAAPIHQYGGLALAPKGDVLATVEDDAADHGVVTLRSVKSGKVLRTIDPCGKCGYAGLTFGPDGSLAFLARDRAAGTVTLMVDAGKAQRPVATIAGIAQTPRWSPDGTRIALLVTIGAAKEAGATQAGVRQVGEIGEHSDEQRLAVFNATGTPVVAAAVKPLSPADRYVYEYDWTPDGKGFVATTALGNGDNNWWVATLDAIDAATGDVRNIARPKTQLNFPRVSPDGKTVAYIGGLMSDFGSVGGDLWTVPFAGGEPVDVTRGAPYTVTSLARTGPTLRATVLRGDSAAVLTEGKAGAVIGWSRPASFAASDGRAAFSADGSTVAMVVQDFTHAPAIFAGPVAAPVQITHDNDAAPALATARSIGWKNDGFDVQGWLLAPIGVDPAVKHPMVTVVHGGPSAANVPNYVQRGAMADLLAAGYYVFLPNPRGSYGQGEAFTAANKRDFGGGDLRDILTGIDAVEKVAPIDDARLGLTGGSYGGFMAMWANTQTNRFKAIVAGAGLSNWVSYYGTNGIDQWMLPFFGETMYDDPKAYEDVSAIYHMKTARTPTFIYVGERDIEVPPTQSIEYWHALKDMGVETSLVIYPEEGHGIRGAANTADLRKRTVAWFDKYLGAGK